MDGLFPNHHPDPTVPKNLEALVSRVKSDDARVGLAYDRDADRLGAVDQSGEIIWGDKLMILFSRAVLRANPHATILGEVKCSQTLYDDIEKHGGRGIMWKTGHSLIKAKMKEEGALLAGEMSGHLFFADRYFGYDDAIYASLRLVELLSEAGATMQELLADVPRTVSTPELRVDCPDEVKFELVARVTQAFRARGNRVVDTDGARISFGGGAWGLVRASNTGPVLVMRFEAGDDAMLMRRFVRTSRTSSRPSVARWSARDRSDRHDVDHLRRAEVGVGGLSYARHREPEARRGGLARTCDWCDPNAARHRRAQASRSPRSSRGFATWSSGADCMSRSPTSSAFGSSMDVRFV